MAVAFKLLASACHFRECQRHKVLHAFLGPLITNHISKMYSSYRRPGTSPDKAPVWKQIDFSTEKIVNGIKKHFKLLKTEIVEHATTYDGQPLHIHLWGQTRVVWKFRSRIDLNRWIASSDIEIGGKSEAYLKLGTNNKSAVFYGTLNTEVPRDGETKYSGYCGYKAKPQLGFFNRKKYYNWTKFNSLYLRVRGDGRPWMINIFTDPYFSHQKDDTYHYFMFTRGGPYWEEITIPFSKFFLCNQGRVQDHQYPLWLDKISTIGFTLGDQAAGPFQLEIDFIGLLMDRTHTEEFAYEQYERNTKF
ncbi:PREDICTED: complex I intermediate-associated protein 30, mitochondrial [Crocodylus porosus]|uniref:Complex I intermediate-associated protein 30, mitochondrial n=1 Tax=Crocodylus porosus TaxID=8502 RepID=A0A7M4FLB0_CROPO|nr:PREDICTED: complex I intermediate-associated protein 30, mitochondrial [Crocodylus porosus]XP_019406750.1 PREDICTED: complex I intermediate-associated protein 30, mitochondrial [Crocodylus porosus]